MSFDRTPALARSLRPAALLLPILLLATSLVPGAGLGTTTSVGGLPSGGGALAAQTIRPGSGASSPAGWSPTVTVSAAPDDVVSGRSSQLSATVSAGSSGYALEVGSYTWSVSGSSSAAISPQGSSDPLLTTGSVAAPTTVVVQVICIGVYATLLYDAPFVASASVGVTLVPPLQVSTITVTPDPATPGTPTDLSLDIQGGLPPFTVAFAFGDGSSATLLQASPGVVQLTHSFSSGTYAPTAVVADESNQSVDVGSSEEEIVAGHLGAAIDVPLGADVGVPTVVRASVGGGSPPYSFAWSDSWGDAAYGGPNWTFSPPRSGTDLLSLQVTDATGGYAVAPTQPLTVEPDPSVAINAQETEGEVGAPFPLELTISGGTAPFLVTWQPGVGAASLTAQFPADGTYLEPYTFSTAGTLWSSAVLTDAAGVTFTTARQVGSIAPPPSLSLSSSPSVPVAGVPFELAATISQGIAPYHWSWIFSGPVSPSTPLSGTLAQPGTVVWNGTSSTGALTATLDVVDGSGAETGTSLEISVQAPLRASISLTGGRGEQDVPLEAVVSVQGGEPPYQLLLTGSDGEVVQSLVSTPGSQVVPLLPRQAGNLTVELQVEDALGRTSQGNATVPIASPLRVQLGLALSPIDAGVAETVSLTLRGGWPPYSGELRASDGQAFPFQGSATRYAFALPCSQAGSLGLEVRASDGLGAVGIASQVLPIDPPPRATLSFASPQADAGVALPFLLTASGGSGVYPSDLVSFGDGNSTTSWSGVHVYARPGLYLANATVSDTGGGQASSPVVEVDVVPAPVAVAVELMAGSDAGLGTAFASEVEYGTAPYSYLWQFGDGAESTQQDPTHVFSTPGRYQVVLTVKDALGSTAVAAPINVTVSPPAALSASANRSTSEVGVSTSFQATILGGALPATVAWSFGDGTEAQGIEINHTYLASGTYTVAATLNDAAGGVETQTFQVLVEPALALAPVALPPRGGEEMTPATVGEVPSGGVAPYRFLWQVGSAQASGSGLEEWTFLPNATGLLAGSVEVLDAEGASAWEAFSVAVAPSLSLNVSSSPAQPEAGVPFRLSVSVSGGVGPFSFQWQVAAAFSPPGNSSGAIEDVALPGTYPASVVVTDALGQQLSVALDVRLSPGLSLELGSSPLQADVGVPWTLPVTLEGGVGTTRTLVETPFGTLVSGGSPVAFPAAGTYPIVVVATDQDGAFSEVATNLTVHPAPTATIVPGLTEVAVGVLETWRADLWGGTEPFLSTWSVPGVGNAGGPEANLSFASPGTYQVEFQAVDAAGGRVLCTQNVTAVADHLALGLNVSSIVGLAPFRPELVVEATGGVGGMRAGVLVNGAPTGPTVGLAPGLPWVVPLDLDQPGTYEVLVQVTDSLGEMANASVSLLSFAPVSSLSWSPTDGAEAGVPLALRASLPAFNATPPAEEQVELAWWGTGVVPAGPGEAIFSTNRSGPYLVELSAQVASTSGEVLENLTIPVPVEVSPAAPSRLLLTEVESPMNVGENATVSLEATDAFGNLESSFEGNLSCRSSTSSPTGSAPQAVAIAGGVASWSLQEHRAGTVFYALSGPLPGPSGFSMVWTANPALAVLRLSSWAREGSALVLNVSALDVFGNPLSNISVTAEVPGGASVTASAWDGNVTLVLPGAAEAQQVELLGPAGSETWVTFPAAGDPSGSGEGLWLLAVFAGSVLAVGLFMTWRRRHRRSPTPEPAEPLPTRSPSEAHEVVQEIIERLPGEDRDTLLRLAEEEGVPRSQAEEALATLEREHRIRKTKDENGEDRWELGTTPAHAPAPPTPSPHAGGGA